MATEQTFKRITISFSLYKESRISMENECDFYDFLAVLKK